MYDHGYTPPILTTDVIAFRFYQRKLQVLLVKRAREPFLGAYALPGGYISAGETTRDACARVLEAKAGVVWHNLGFVDQLYTFDTVARDPRGHAVSVAYMGVGYDITPVETEETQGPVFHSVDTLPDLAYDHAEIIELAVVRLRTRLETTNAAFALLPSEFTLTDLQAVYEAVFGRLLDKRNFRKKIMSLDMIHETGEISKAGAFRPAKLYAFNYRSLQILDVNFG